MAHSFATTTVVGSTVLGVAHISGDKLDYCMLGDVQMFLYRESQNHGACQVMTTEAVRLVSDQHPQGIPPQCFLPDATSQSFAYVENVFRQSKFGTIKDLRVNDTIIMASDGVTVAAWSCVEDESTTSQPGVTRIRGDTQYMQANHPVQWTTCAVTDDRRMRANKQSVNES